jgi:hypothetical protein
MPYPAYERLILAIQSNMAIISTVSDSAGPLSLAFAVGFSLGSRKAESLVSSKQSVSTSATMCTTNEAQPSFSEIFIALDEKWRPCQGSEQGSSCPSLVYGRNTRNLVRPAF